MFTERDPKRHLDVRTIVCQRPEQTELIEPGERRGVFENLDGGERVRREDVDVGFDTFPRPEMGCRDGGAVVVEVCLLYTSPSPRDGLLYRMPSSA